MLLEMELLILLAVLIKADQGVTLMLFLVALVVIQLPPLFLLVQQTHHQVNLLVLLAVALIALGVVVHQLGQVEAYSIGQEHVPEQTVVRLLRLTQETVVLSFVGPGVTG
jgi:hypothetical protein